VAPADSAIPVAGNALERLESGDSLLPEAAAALVGSDWIVGDTITGYFASVEAAPDSAAAAGEVAAAPGTEPDTTVVLERLVAVGAARSLYHVAPEEGAAEDARDGINFLSAAQIELTFADGQVQVANVAGLRRGMYLEPLAAAAEPDAGTEPDDATQPDDTTQPDDATQPDPGAEPPVAPTTGPLPARNPGGNP
jgi:hypothetical protein